MTVTEHRSGLPGAREVGGVIKEGLGNCGCDGYVHYLECNNGSMGVYMSNLIKGYTFNMCSLLYVHYTSI